MEEDGRAVLGADVVALAVEGRGIVDGEEDAEEVLVRDLVRVVGDFHRLRMSATPAANLVVGGIGGLAADVARLHGVDPFQLVENRFQAPETPSGERCNFRGHPSLKQPVKYSSWQRPNSRNARRAPGKPCPSRGSRATCCSRNTRRTVRPPPPRFVPASHAPWRRRSPTIAAPTGKRSSSRRRSVDSSPRAASTPRPER